jgi:hypothetical protein
MIRPPRATPFVVFALASALWFASTLGFMHRTLHLHATPRSMAAALQASAVAEASVPVPAKSLGGLEALFGFHTDADCRLYDQLAGGAAAPSVASLVLPIAMPMARFHYFLGEAIARWVVLFDARGPPATR